MMFSIRRLLVASALSVTLVVVAVSVALAHADYGSSVPAAGSTVAAVPSVVKGTFVEPVNPKGSSFTVTGPDGSRADNGDGHVDLTDPNRFTMLVTLKTGLGPGKYTVNWATVSALDGDAANGSFTFTVSAPAPNPAPAVKAPAAVVAPGALPKTGGLPIFPIAFAGFLLATTGIVVRRRGH